MSDEDKNKFRKIQVALSIGAAGIGAVALAPLIPVATVGAAIATGVALGTGAVATGTAVGLATAEIIIKLDGLSLFILQYHFW